MSKHYLRTSCSVNSVRGIIVCVQALLTDLGYSLGKKMCRPNDIPNPKGEPARRLVGLLILTTAIQKAITCDTNIFWKFRKV